MVVEVRLYKISVARKDAEVAKGEVNDVLG